jgi:alpha-beta hydrolase superfamily lysophospholipase
MEHASEFKVPLLMIHGEGDRLNSVEGTRKFFEAVRLPEKKLLVVPGGHHEPHNDVGFEQVLHVMAAHLPPSGTSEARSAARA